MFEDELIEYPDSQLVCKKCDMELFDLYIEENFPEKNWRV